MEYLYWMLLIVGGFLSGGIMFSELIPKKFANTDVCAVSVDQNPGVFNAFKHCGKKIGILCLVLDLMKGFLPVLIASLCMNAHNTLYALTLLAPVLGHAAGVFNHFHGGKCIAVSFGVMLGMIPVSFIGFVTLAALYLTFSCLFKIRNAAKRSVLVYALFALLSCSVLTALGQLPAAVGCGAIALTVILKFLLSKNGLVENRYHEHAA